MAASRLAPFACFAREILRKWPVWGPKIAIMGQKWPENGVFRQFLTNFRLRGPLRLVSVDDFLSEAYGRTDQAEFLVQGVKVGSYDANHVNGNIRIGFNDFVGTNCFKSRSR